MKKATAFIFAMVLVATTTSQAWAKKPNPDDFECYYSEDGSQVRCFKKEDAPKNAKPAPTPQPYQRQPAPQPEYQYEPPPPPPPPAPRRAYPQRNAYAEDSDRAYGAWEDSSVRVTHLSGFKLGYWMYTDGGDDAGLKQKDYSTWGVTAYEHENMIVRFFGIALGVSLTGKQIKQCEGTYTFLTINPYVHALFHSSTLDNPHIYGGAGLGAYGVYIDIKDADESAFGFGLGFHLVGGGYLPVTSTWGVQLEMRYAIISDVKLKFDYADVETDISHLLIQVGSMWRY